MSQSSDITDDSQECFGLDTMKVDIPPGWVFNAIKELKFTTFHGHKDYKITPEHLQTFSGTDSHITFNQLYANFTNFANGLGAGMYLHQEEDPEANPNPSFPRPDPFRRFRINSLVNDLAKSQARAQFELESYIWEHYDRSVGIKSALYNCLRQFVVKGSSAERSLNLYEAPLLLTNKNDFSIHALLEVYKKDYQIAELGYKERKITNYLKYFKTNESFIQYGRNIEIQRNELAILKHTITDDEIYTRLKICLQESSDIPYVCPAIIAMDAIAKEGGSYWPRIMDKLAELQMSIDNTKTNKPKYNAFNTTTSNNDDEPPTKKALIQMKVTSKTKCFYCDTPGHIASTCRAKPGNPDFNQKRHDTVMAIKAKQQSKGNGNTNKSNNKETTSHPAKQKEKKSSSSDSKQSNDGNKITKNALVTTIIKKVDFPPPKVVLKTCSDYTKVKPSVRDVKTTYILEARIGWSNGTIPPNSVIIDSGCEQHIVTPALVDLLQLEPEDAEHIYIQFGHGEKSLSTQTVSYGIMQDARIVSTASFAANLLSVSQLTKAGYMFTMDSKSARIFHPRITDVHTPYIGQFSDQVLEAKCYPGGLYAFRPYCLLDIESKNGHFGDAADEKDTDYEGKLSSFGGNK
jgi:hypothetical protein